MITPSYERFVASGSRAKTASGYEVFWRAVGPNDAPTIVFFHGYPTSSFDWESATAVLSKTFRCVMFDFLGFGASAKPNIPYRFTLQHEALAAVVAAAGVERAFTIAHDYGGTLAQELLARHGEGRAPFEIRGAIFMNGGLDAKLHRPILLQRIMASRFGPLLAPLVNQRAFERSFRQVIARKDRIDYAEVWSIASRDRGNLVLPRLLHYIAERRENRERWIGALAKANVPLGFVWGKADPVSGAHVLPLIRSTCPAAEILELDGVGHYPQLEASEVVGDWLDRTLQS